MSLVLHDVDLVHGKSFSLSQSGAGLRLGLAWVEQDRIEFSRSCQIFANAEAEQLLSFSFTLRFDWWFSTFNYSM